MSENKSRSVQEQIGDAAVLASELTESLGTVSRRWGELTPDERRTMLVACAEAMCELVAGFGSVCDSEGVEPKSREVAP